MKKECSICHDDKELEQFNKKRDTKDGHQLHCRECANKASKHYYRENRTKHLAEVQAIKRARVDAMRQFIADYKTTHSCVDCGEADPDVLEFDHVRGKKSFTIGESSTRYYSIDRVRQEIAKCDIRCANCHRKRTVLARRAKEKQMQLKPSDDGKQQCHAAVTQLVE
jgi:hypothetical protein